MQGMQSCSLEHALTSAGLQDICVNLRKHSIKNPDHVVECSLVDIIHLGQATYGQAEFVLKTAAALLAPRCVPLKVLLKSERCNVRLPLGLSGIDSALGCGLLVGAITELVGSAGLHHSADYPDSMSLSRNWSERDMLQESESRKCA